VAQGLRIGEVARAAGVAPSALRFYEEAGVLDPTRRSAAGYRIYAEGAIGRIDFIRRAQALGLTLVEVRRLVAAPAAPAAEERDRLRHAVAHRLAETRRRQADLERLSGELGRLYVRLARAPGPECGHLGDCGCWLPTEEEVMAMDADVQSAVAHCEHGRCCPQCCPDCDGVTCC
jgi:DNA-binding transcriptional MerR regulator